MKMLLKDYKQTGKDIAKKLKRDWGKVKRGESSNVAQYECYTIGYKKGREQYEI